MVDSNVCFDQGVSSLDDFEFVLIKVFRNWSIRIHVLIRVFSDWLILSVTFCFVCSIDVIRCYFDLNFSFLRELWHDMDVISQGEIFVLCVPL